MRKNCFSRLFECAVMIVAFSLIINSMVFATNESTSHKVNVNQATVKELSSVRGIGKKKATAIVAYRNAEGTFESIEGLKKVKGIGIKTFERIKDYLTVGDG